MRNAVAPTRRRSDTPGWDRPPKRAQAPRAMRQHGVSVRTQEGGADAASPSVSAEQYDARRRTSSGHTSEACSAAVAGVVDLRPVSVSA